MSTEKKPDAARGWQFVETLLAEEEDERFEKLSEEEQLAELRSAGARAAGDWDAAELLAIAAGHAAKERHRPSSPEALRGPSLRSLRLTCRSRRSPRSRRCKASRPSSRSGGGGGPSRC